MQRKGVIVLIVWVLTSGPMLQLFRLPDLIQHFQEHQSKDETLTFSEFLYMHYVGTDGDLTDDSKDESLPFKNPQSDKADGDLYAQNRILFMPYRFIGGSNRKEFFNYRLLLTSSDLKEVFRPPLG